MLINALTLNLLEEIITMTKKVPAVAALILFCALAAMPVPAQDYQTSAKNLYIAHSRNSRQGKPGVRITVRLNRNGRISTVPASYNFKSGDKIQFLFETNFNAHVRILNLGTRGDLQTLYPYAGAQDDVAMLRSYEIPRGAWFEFDNVPGTEQLAFVFSRRPIQAQPESYQSATTAGQISQSRPPQAASAGSDQDQALQALNSRALEEGLQNAKNLTLVPDTQGDEVCAYGIVNLDQIDRVHTFKINLKHR